MLQIFILMIKSTLLLKNKLILLVAFVLLGLTTGFAQQKVDFNTVVTPDDYRAKTFEGYLVQLAWINSPENLVLNYKVQIAEQEKKIQKWEWTDDLALQLNYNEAHFINDFFPPINNDETDPLVQSLVFPRFNFGARIRLSTLVNRGNERQIKDLELKMAEADIDQQKLLVRAKTLEQYRTLRSTDEVLKIRIQAEEDAEERYKLATSLFKQGQAKLEEFTQAATSFFAAKESTLESKSKREIAEIKLEELIGISYEDAQKTGPPEEGKEKKKSKKKPKKKK